MFKDNKVLSITKKVLWGVLLAIFAFIAVVAIWLMIDKFILKSPVPSIFGYSSLTVETGSMQGTVDIGDMIIIKKQDEYKIGDIITYLHEGDKIPTTHRIINYNEDGSFVTRGDSNNTKDPEPVTEDIILGEVVKVYPKVGIFATWIRTEGWLYIVACLAILGLGLFIISSNDEETEEKTEAEAPTDATATECDKNDTEAASPDNVDDVASDDGENDGCEDFSTTDDNIPSADN